MNNLQRGCLRKRQVTSDRKCIDCNRSQSFEPFYKNITLVFARCLTDRRGDTFTRIAIDAEVRPKPCTTMTVSASFVGGDEHPDETHRSTKVTGTRTILIIIGAIVLTISQRILCAARRRRGKIADTGTDLRYPYLHLRLLAQLSTVFLKSRVVLCKLRHQITTRGRAWT